MEIGAIAVEYSIVEAGVAIVFLGLANAFPPFCLVGACLLCSTGWGNALE